MRIFTYLLTFSLSLAVLVAGCAGPSRAVTTLKVAEFSSAMGQPERLTESVFKKPNLDESAIQRVLDAPVEVEFPARAGVVVLNAPFSRAAYATLEPGDRAPQQLSRAIERSKHFQLVSDISPHLAQGQSVEGLRELATRYRLKYLVVLNRRFADRSHVNGFGWAWISLVGIPFAPAYTLKTQGLFEATLMDVRTGTFLFTTQVHVQAWKRDTPFGAEDKLAELQRTASMDAVRLLAKRFLARCDRVEKQKGGEAAGGEAVAAR